jgi:hypothetical protein
MDVNIHSLDWRTPYLNNGQSSALIVCASEASFNLQLTMIEVLDAKLVLGTEQPPENAGVGSLRH